MTMRRDARQHQTVGSQQHEETTSAAYWEYRPEQPVMTIDGPGRVVAVYDGPFPGSEEYEVALQGGIGGGRYSPGQITAAGPVQASVGLTDASVTHTATEDYPELGNLLIDRPNPATMRHLASLASDSGGMSGGGLSGMTSGGVNSTTDGDGPVGGDEEGGVVAWNPGEYNNALYHDWRQASVSHSEDDPDKVYLRFGHWPKDERSSNNVIGGKEDGVSVYDLDHHGEPMDPDPDMGRYHVHDQHCDEDCDLDQWNDDYGNDAGQEMRDRTHRAERRRNQGYTDTDHPDTPHLVKGKFVGIGHDGEPLLHNVRRVGDWIDHRHKFIPTAEPHHLARSEDDEDYEPHEGEHTQLKLFGAKDEERDWHAGDPDEWAKEGGFCYTGHPGPCRYNDPKSDSPESRQEEIPFGRRQAMPSRKYPDHPAGFSSELASGYGTHLNGYVNDRRIGSIEHTAYDEHGRALSHRDDPAKATHLKVHMLIGGGVPGAASAMMDHLYDKYPNAMINHGYRTEEGLRWWNSYEEPDPHRNVHNVSPHKWDHMFDRDDVARDIHRNEANDPGHHSDHHNIDWVHDHHNEYDGDDSDSDKYCEHCDEFGHTEDKHPKCEGCGAIGHDADDEEHHPTTDPDPTEVPLHHGTSVRLSPEAHRFVHDQSIPEEHRAHRLLDEIGRGNMPGGEWHADENQAHRETDNHAFNRRSEPNVAHSPVTRVVLHSEPFDHDEVHDRHGDPVFSTNGSSASFENHHFPINHALNGISWGRHSSRDSSHGFEDPEPVGQPLAQDNRSTHQRGYQPHEMQERARQRQEHEERYAPRADPHPSGTAPWHGEQQKLFAMLITAAYDPSFKFHFTAAWRDVRTKAVRIRKSGGVNITHVSDGMIFANVRGDHHVYETGLQRVPGRRQAVAVYSCGCRWGAYHWGADDDMSRFAGRMCSHALALQYEAQSRGMFGRDIEMDDTKPKWVPSKVVVKYDIADGKNMTAHSRRTSLAGAQDFPVVPEQSPLMIMLALADEETLSVLAAANDMFGDSVSYSEPAYTNPLGPTSPPNPTVNPTSAGPFTTGEPDNWGSINGPTMLPGVMSSLDEGAEATLHEEPEGALPSTDGEDHTASMINLGDSDADLTGGSGIGSIEHLGDEALTPDDLSMQTQGSAEDFVAQFQRSAAAQSLMGAGTSTGMTDSMDIAAAAQAHLSKTAGSSFTAAEQDALINENPGTQASNTDRLDIAGTHYADLEQRPDHEDDYAWLM